MASDEEQQRFLLMKFSVLQHQEQQFKSDPASVGGYAYAWANGVYPALHHFPWHAPFHDSFDVSEEEMMAVYALMDDHCVTKKPITFYDLERHFEVNDPSSSAGKYTRSKLCRIVRYVALGSIPFPPNFWGTLLKNGEAPSEALSLTSPLERYEISPLD